MKQQIGLPLQLGGVPGHLSHGKRTLKLTVTSFGTPVVRATVAVHYKGHAITVLTDSRGRARVSGKLPSGKLTITVSFPGAATATSTLRVH